MDSPNHELYQKMIKVFKEHGHNVEDNVLIEKLNLTNIPSDVFQSEVHRRRAEHLAEGYDEKYYCHACGEVHETDENFFDCMQNHIFDAMAGIPIKRTKEHADWQVSQLPVSMRPFAREVLKPHIKK